jgi:hypothetical protein
MMYLFRSLKYFANFEIDIILFDGCKHFLGDNDYGLTGKWQPPLKIFPRSFSRINPVQTTSCLILAEVLNANMLRKKKKHLVQYRERGNDSRLMVKTYFYVLQKPK